MKSILRYCIPTMLALVMNGFYAIMDGLFIGQTAGDVGLAAINLAWPIPAVIIATGIGLGVGGSILYSQEIGRGNWDNGKRVLIFTIGFLMLAGTILTVVFRVTFPRILVLLGATGAVYEGAYAYLNVIIYGCIFQVLGTGFLPILRNLDLPIHAMYVSSSGMVVNLLLNYIFIVQMKMGIQGAAYGTIVAQAVVIVLTIIIVKTNKRTKTLLKGQGQDLKEPDKAGILIPGILKRAIAPFGLSLAPSLVLIFSNFACLFYGGTEGVASYTVISYITFPIQNMLLGVGEGLQPLMSFCYGGKQIQRLEYIEKVGRRIGVGISFVATVVTFCVAKEIARIFGISEVATTYFIIGMKINAVAFFFIALLKFQISVENATGNSAIAMKLTYLESCVVAPVLIFALSYVLELNGVWLSYPFTSVVMCFILLLLKRQTHTTHQKQQ